MTPGNRLLLLLVVCFLIPVGFLIWFVSASSSIEAIRAPLRESAEGFEERGVASVAMETDHESPSPVSTAMTGTITGKVLEKGSGTPVEGLLVKAEVVSDVKLIGGRTRDEDRSDSTGVFAMENLLAGYAYRLDVEDEGAGYVLVEGAEVDLSDTAPLEEAVLWVVRPGSITGTVYLRKMACNKEPLDPASLSLKPNDSEAVIRVIFTTALEKLNESIDQPQPNLEVVLDRSWGGTLGHTLTDAWGRYSFVSVPPGPYRVRVVPPKTAPWIFKDHHAIHKRIHLDPGEHEQLDLFIPGDCAFFKGRVLDETGRPVPDARVTAEAILEKYLSADDRESYGIRLRREPMQSRTDQEGNYVLPALEAASFNDAIDYIRDDKLPRFSCMVTVERAGFVSIRVLAPPFTPQMEQSVRAFYTRAYEAFSIMNQEAREPGELDLYKHKPEPIFEDGAQRLPDIVLLQGAVLSGVVIDASNTPLAWADVRAIFSDPKRDRKKPITPFAILPHKVLADDKGIFEIEGLPPGTYTFEVTTMEGKRMKVLSPPKKIYAKERIEKVRVLVSSDE